MIFLIYVLFFLFSCIFLVVSILFIVFMSESLIKGHDLPTSPQTTRVLFEVIKKYKPDAKNFYDLGCAHGTLSLRLKKVLPNFTIYGIDNSYVRIFFAKIKSKILCRDVNFQRQDIFETDLRNADVVYTYLWYDIMPILEKKLREELKKGSLVITSTSHFKNWEPKEKIATYRKVPKIPNFETLFIYINK